MPRVRTKAATLNYWRGQPRRKWTTAAPDLLLDKAPHLLLIHGGAIGGLVRPHSTTHDNDDSGGGDDDDVAILVIIIITPTAAAASPRSVRTP